MHYIRFLKPPRVLPDGPHALTAKITITTDLGEVFLAADVVLLVELEDGSGRLVGGSKEYMWRGSMGIRALEVVAPVTTRGQALKMLVMPKEKDYAVDNFEAIFEVQHLLEDSDDRGGIVAVRSMPVDLAGKQKISVGLAERVFNSGAGNTEVKVHIWEETGESIARHIWDAGLVISSYLATLCQRTKPKARKSKPLPHLPTIEQLLSRKHLNIIELGAGCGIVSITLSLHYPSISQLLLTDLPEASSILDHNLSYPTFPSNPQSQISHQVLDWSCPLPLNVEATKWDLVLVADCTYNPDVVPDLVKTLAAITEANREVVLCLAMKVRHESEMVFFKLMEERGFVVRDKCSLPLTVLGGEKEEILILIFGHD